MRTPAPRAPTRHCRAKLSEEVYATTHGNISLYISTNKRWWQFWKPAEITVIVSATVNRDLGVSLSPKSINF